MRFSRRLPADREDNEIARALASTGPAELDLTVTNPTSAGLSPDADEIGEALAGADCSRYAPEPRGERRAREAVATEYARAGARIDPDRIVLTASSSESYSFLLKLLCDPGDLVAAPEPSYPLLEHLARLEAVSRVAYPLRYRPHDGGWRFDLSSVERVLEQNVRALLIVQPNNPTGTLLSPGEAALLDRLTAAAETALISDEVFLEFADPGADGFAGPIAAAETETLAFSLGGLSKSCGLPQMKLGWIAVGGAEPAVREAIDRLEHIADTYLSVGTPVQAALPDLLDVGRKAASRIRERVLRNRETLCAAVAAVPSETGLRLEASEGGWSAVLELPPEVDESRFVLDLLRDNGVLVHPGWFYDFPIGPVIVLSLLPEPDVFRTGISRLLSNLVG